MFIYMTFYNHQTRYHRHYRCYNPWRVLKASRKRLPFTCYINVITFKVAMLSSKLSNHLSLDLPILLPPAGLL